MIEGLKKLYSGENAFQRHIVLFSICGIVGLFEAYVQMNPGRLENIGMFLLSILFEFFVCGYETIFLKERELPETDLRSLKLVLKKPILIVFLAGIPLLYLTKFHPRYASIAFLLEILLVVPLTTIQAGYSYNYDEHEAFEFWYKIRFFDYFSLMFKRIWVIICSYAIVFISIFILFFIVGFTCAFIFRGDIASLSLIMSSQQDIIYKLSNYFSMIAIVYILTIGTLVWDYELITMKERTDEID